MKRDKHSLSHYKLLTCDPGELVPIACFEALPGDSIQQATGALVRASPLLAPVMHPFHVRIHHWFVPMRLIWEDWEDFITGGPDGADASVAPTITANFAAGALGDYLGVPPGVASTIASALPFRAYNLIWNENYRDPDLSSERALSIASGADATTAVTLAKVAWEKDRFTVARPDPQKGPDVTLPIGTSAPVKTSASDQVTGVQEPMKMNQSASGNKPGANAILGAAITSGNVNFDTMAAANPGGGAYPSNLYADLANATPPTIGQWREAMALQRYQEARAQYGSRYVEYLRYLGVRSSDSRLQRPEYLGGGKQTIAFSEIIQSGTNFDANTGVGTMRGHGISAVRSNRYRRFFEEHGIVMSLLSIRPKTMYVNGLPKMWSRSTKEEYWQKELELIGQEEVLNKEIYSADSGPNDTFGWSDRYDSYRRIESQVSGDFRSTLNMWHEGRIFASDVTLNESFVLCSPSKRIFASTATDTFWIMANHSIQARRMVRRGSVGRIM